ncbi:MAG: site-specific integrase [Pseudomonadota bacterium]
MPFRTAKSKIWQYDIQIKGRRFRGSTGTDNFETAKAVEAEIRRNAKRVQKASYTLSEAFGTYHLEISQHQPSAATSASQAKALLKVIPGKSKLEDLTDSDVMRAVAKMRASCANGTVNRRLQYLGRAIKHMATIHKAEVTELSLKQLEVKEPQERVRELSFNEQQRLFEHLPADLREPVSFCLLTGARISTMADLRWTDIGDQEIFFRLKGDQRMTFPISREMQALLSALPRSNVIEESRFVFTRLHKQTAERCRIVPKGGVFNQQFRQAVHDAEIPDFRFHDLRHTFATRMLRQCKNLKLVSQLLGHKDISSTMKYAHVLVDDMRHALEEFSPLSGGEPQTFPQNIPLKH